MCAPRRPRAWPTANRFEITQLSTDFTLVTLHFGFMEQPHIPRALAAMRKAGLKFDIMTTSFFLGSEDVESCAKLRHAPMAGPAVHRDEQAGGERAGLLQPALGPRGRTRRANESLTKARARRDASLSHQSRPRPGSPGAHARAAEPRCFHADGRRSTGPGTRKRQSGLTRFELACLASHRNAWRQFLGTPDRSRLLSRRRHSHLAGLQGAGRRRRVGPVRRPFGEDRHLSPEGEARRAATRPGRPQVARLYTPPRKQRGLHLSRRGAERYLALTARPTLPADYAIFPKNGRRLGLRIYQLTPAVAIQDHLRPAAEGGRTFATAMSAGGPARTRRSPSPGSGAKGPAWPARPPRRGKRSISRHS